MRLSQAVPHVCKLDSGRLVALSRDRLVRVIAYPLPPTKVRLRLLKPDFYHDGSAHHFLGRRFDSRRGIWRKAAPYPIDQVEWIYLKRKTDRYPLFKRRNAAGRPSLLTVTENGASAASG